MEFTHGEIAKNSEDGGTWGLGQERGAQQMGLQLRQQTPQGALVP